MHSQSRFEARVASCWKSVKSGMSHFLKIALFLPNVVSAGLEENVATVKSEVNYDSKFAGMSF